MLCVCLGTTQNFISSSCAVFRAWCPGGAATSGGAGRAGTARAVRSAACVRVLAAADAAAAVRAQRIYLAVLGVMVLARRSVSVAAACARTRRKEGGGLPVLAVSKAQRRGASSARVVPLFLCSDAVGVLQGGRPEERSGLLLVV